MAKLLLLEDDIQIATTVSDWLKAQHHIVEIARTIADAEGLLSFAEYDVLILDWNLPDGEGIEVLKTFRQKGGSTPALMLTAKNEIDDKLAGFSAGSDDYLTKPFDLRELQMRVEALLKRRREVPSRKLSSGSLVMDKETFNVTRAGQTIKLLPKEFALLDFFMRHPNEVFSAETILRRVWISEEDISTDTVFATLKRLRKKIDKPGETSLIENVFAVGYKFVPPKD